MDLVFSEEAAEFYRLVPLFDRLALFDLFESMRTGRIPEEDYGEITESGILISVFIVEKFAVSFSVNEESKIIQVADICFADS